MIITSHLLLFVQVRKVLFTYQARAHDELDLIDGDFIFFDEAEVESSTDGWYMGTSWLTGCTGLFAGSYTERTAESETWTMHRSEFYRFLIIPLVYNLCVLLQKVYFKGKHFMSDIIVVSPGHQGKLISKSTSYKINLCRGLSIIFFLKQSPII